MTASPIGFRVTSALFVLLCASASFSQEKRGEAIRVVTFNIQELTANKLAEGPVDGPGANPQLRKAAEIIQRIRPDVLLINEIDFDAARHNAKIFQQRYLGHSHNGATPIQFADVYFEEVNTGVPSGRDFDKNGKQGDPEDGFGFGRYPGQYGMALYSNYAIDRANVRTFRKLLWKSMPANLIPDGKQGRPKWYSEEDLEVFRLSSKSHWDVPIKIGGTTVHFLCSHPTPPVFDGPEDRNGRRNFDEIRLWADYLTAGDAANYIRDDKGMIGGLASAEHFVLLGDLNADPTKDKEVPYGVRAIDQVLMHPRVQRIDPISKGAVERYSSGAPVFRGRWTAHFGRADYVLPSKGLTVKQAEIFWPTSKDSLSRLYDKPSPASDHHPVWVDLAVPSLK